MYTDIYGNVLIPPFLNILNLFNVKFWYVFVSSTCSFTLSLKHYLIETTQKQTIKCLTEYCSTPLEQPFPACITHESSLTRVKVKT